MQQNDGVRGVEGANVTRVPLNMIMMIMVLDVVVLVV